MIIIHVQQKPSTNILQNGKLLVIFLVKYRDIFISSLNKNMVDENEEEIDFKTLDIENSNDNDESEINKKDEETLDDLITSKTKEVPVVIID